MLYNSLLIKDIVQDKNQNNDTISLGKFQEHTANYHTIKHSIQRWYTADEINNMFKEGLKRYKRSI